MNRSILIVICDFLLVSLLAFSNFNTLTQPPETRGEAPSGAAAKASEDMVSALKLALDDERENRAVLASELVRTRESVETQQAILEEREGEIQRYQASLRATEAEARQLEDQRVTLLQQIGWSQTNLANIQRSLTDTKVEARLSQEQLQQLQRDLEAQRASEARLRDQLAGLERNHSNVVAEKMQLNTRLQVAEAEKKMTAQQIVEMKSEVQTIRAEKAELQATTLKLAEKVSTLAEKSDAVAAEIRDHRALTANAIFDEFNQNRLEAQFLALKPGVLGQDFRREKKTRSILVTDGSRTCALFHLADTPLGLSQPESDWASLTGVFGRGLTSFPVGQLAFLRQDPRVLAMPVETSQTTLLGVKVYAIAPDPFQFQEAVLVGSADGYYGESQFQIDLTTPGYVKMDRSLFRGLFGKFNPSRGDLVLSKTGHLLGIMVNNDYCAVLRGLDFAETVQCGTELRAQQTEQKVAQLQKQFMTLPVKLR